MTTYCHVTTTQHRVILDMTTTYCHMTTTHITWQHIVMWQLHSIVWYMTWQLHTITWQLRTSHDNILSCDNYTASCNTWHDNYILSHDNYTHHMTTYCHVTTTQHCVIHDMTTTYCHMTTTHITWQHTVMWQLHSIVWYMTWQLHTVNADVEWLSLQRCVHSCCRQWLHQHLIVKPRWQLQLHGGFISINYMSLPLSQSTAVYGVYSAVLNCHAIADIMALARRHWLQHHVIIIQMQFCNYCKRARTARPLSK